MFYLVDETLILKSPFYDILLFKRLRYNKKLYNNIDSLVFTFFVISLSLQLIGLYKEERKKRIVSL